MKNAILYIFLFIIALASIWAILYGLRFLNSATIQTQIVNPKEGIECVIVSTSDGASIDCEWGA